MSETENAMQTDRDEHALEVRLLREQNQPPTNEDAAPPCPWTRDQVENMATRLDPLEKNGSPLGPNEWGAIDMLRYLAASLTRRTE